MDLYLSMVNAEKAFYEQVYNDSIYILKEQYGLQDGLQYLEKKFIQKYTFIDWDSFEDHRRFRHNLLDTFRQKIIDCANNYISNLKENSEIIDSFYIQEVFQYVFERHSVILANGILNIDDLCEIDNHIQLANTYRSYTTTHKGKRYIRAEYAFPLENTKLDGFAIRTPYLPMVQTSENNGTSIMMRHQSATQQQLRATAKDVRVFTFTIVEEESNDYFGINTSELSKGSDGVDTEPVISTKVMSCNDTGLTEDDLNIVQLSPSVYGSTSSSSSRSSSMDTNECAVTYRPKIIPYLNYVI